jgi:hypothetical protein
LDLHSEFCEFYMLFGLEPAAASNRPRFNFS